MRFTSVRFKTKRFQKNNRFKANNSGVLLIETMLYIVLSTVTITLLFQLTLQIYTQSKLMLAQQTERNNLWVATDLLQRDLRKLDKKPVTNVNQAAGLETKGKDLASLVHWSLRNHKLYRQVAARPICMLEQVQAFEIISLAPNLAQILVTATCGAKSEQVTRSVFLRNF